MRTHAWLKLAAFGVLLACAGAAVADVTDDDIQQSIDKAVAWMFTQQRPNGWFSDTGWFGYGPNPPVDRRVPGGYETMAMLGLTFAPVKISDERMKKGFDAILAMELKHTYTIAPRIMVISRLLKKLDRERQERAMAVLKKDVQWMQEAQNGVGAWGYNYEARKHDTYGWDFSNTQMAILALSEAEMAGIELNPEVLLKVQKLYLDRQRADGGWNYGMRGGFQAGDHPDGAAVGSYGSMTAAAVATLFITRDFLYRGVGCPCRGERSGRRPKKLDEAIDRGLDWLGKHFDVKRNPFGSIHHWKYYWLYSCERVGLAAGIKYFGTHDWYREGAEEVVGTQAADGSWSKNVFRTAYAICFLAKGRAPVLFNKLKFKGQWNNHPRDIRNLARYVGTQKEQPFNWQVITLQAAVADWHDAPILYITAETTPELSDEEKQKLRRFTDTGGTILFEASCGNRKIGAWFRNTAKQLWPEWELKPLAREHPLWSSDTRMGRRPRLFGMDDGIRTAVLLSTADVSCPWNTMAVTRRGELFDLGTNLYVYATDRRPLRARLAATRKADKEAYTGTQIVPGKRATLKLARVKHSGDWYTGRNYDGPGALAAALAAKSPEEAIAEQLRQEAQLPTEPGAGGGLTLETIPETAAADLKPDQVQIAYLAGRQSIDLSQADTVALKRYLASGGFLLAEAILGNPRAAETMQTLAARLGLKMRRVGKGHPLLTGTMDGATGYPLENMKYTHSLKAARVGKGEPELFELTLGGKPVGVYSPFDLMYCQPGYAAWNCRGYAPDDARAILTNILLLVSTR